MKIRIEQGLADNIPVVVVEGLDAHIKKGQQILTMKFVSGGKIEERKVMHAPEMKFMMH